MKYTIDNIYNNELKSDCKNCFGLCCTALFFSVCDGFPQNKDAGKPCINLKNDFTCSIHNNLRKKGLKGCTSYECFGAGQKTSQITCNGVSWRDNSQSASDIFDSFLIIRQLHEIMWYLTQAYSLQHDYDIKTQIGNLIDHTIDLTLLNMDRLLKLDIESHRDKVNLYLKNTSEYIRKKSQEYNLKSSSNVKKKIKGKVFLGKNLTNYNLCGADLRGALLIAANLSNTDLNGADFIGADLRDTDLSGADLSKSIFLSQAQINSAKGNEKTKLPPMITRPDHWK
ncbi:pentapeptide repeat-containing protein [uncultured Clostridium sp.]|uniref:pentapeptide repeat-containing protein n=1 Tax=uncultured Clostridium sp. TaxID=59620 RepID=UPI0025E92DD0|nr:pentapeptide repeat-containing protein [uncultured Clostridium sp.]